MKRNDLVARSLTLGLAVATAAASMSTPGGLMAPVTVQAEATGATTGAQQAQADKTFAAMDSKVFEAYNGWTGRPQSVTDFGDYTITTGETTGSEVAVTVTGTAKYVKGFTGFNTAESGQQSGYYVAWQLQVPADAAENATYLLQSADGTEVRDDVNYKSYNKDVLDEGNDSKKYLSCIFYLTPETAKTKTQKVIVDWDGNGNGNGAEQTYTIDYSALKFEIPGTAIIKNGESALSTAPEVGNQLTAAITQETEASIAEYRYQWYKTKEGTTTPITDATSASYTVTAADLGYTLSVGIFVKDNTSYNELKSTETQTVVDNTAPTLVNIATPTGEKLTDTTATISLQANEDCTVYYVVKGSDTESMEADAIKNDGGTKTVNLTKDTAVEETIEGLKANKGYKIFVTAVDAAENASVVQTVSFTTNQTAMAGTASIQTNDGQEITTLTIGDTVKAVYSGSDTKNLKYEWYRIPVQNGVDSTEQKIDGATEATYTLTAEDKNCKIKVVISDKDGNLSDSKAAITTATVAMKPGKSLSFGADCYDSEAKTLKVAVDAGTEASALEYSTDGGQNWATGGDKLTVSETTATLALENQSYAENSIQIRFKETADTAAGAAAVYDKAITVSLAGSVSIAESNLKYNQIITAIPKGTQVNDSSKLNYKFFRVKDGQTTLIDRDETTSSYTLTADDIGAKIKVVVTAEGYDGTLEYTTTNEITPAAARAVEAINTENIDKTQDLTTKTQTYTLESLSDEGAKYAAVSGQYNSYAEYKSAHDNTDLSASDWKDSPSFSGLAPNTNWTFFVTYDQADTRYEKSTIQSATVTIDKLDRPVLSLNVTVEATVDGGKKVTITPIDDAVYSFEGNADDKYSSTNVKEYGSAVSSQITVAIKYPTNELFKDVEPQTQNVDLSYSTQTAPAAAGLSFTVKGDKSKYLPTITEPTDETAELEYSFDGQTYKGKDEFAAIEFGASETVNLYVRKKAQSNTFASPATVTTVTTPDASTAPTINGSTSFRDSVNVTITAGEGATIYYTMDGTDPTIDQEKLYSTAIPVKADIVIKAIAVEEGKIVSTVASKTFTKDTSPVKPVTPPTNNNNWGSSTTTTPSTDDKKPETKPETKPENQPVTETETKADGTQVTTTETKAEDGSVTAKVELKNETTGVEATVKVAKDADGKVTDATAAVTQTSADKKAGISAATVAQITEAAGTKAVEINAEIVDESGNTLCRLAANAEDLKAGNKLKVLKYDSKTREYVLVNKTTYKVDKDGNVAMNDLKRARYMVVTASEAEAFSKQVLKTVKVETAKKNVTAGKKTKITLDDGLNMANVAKITYKTSRKSVATVNKNGTITTKKAGTVTIRATVTLKNGETKSVKMTLTVKKAK